LKTTKEVITSFLGKVKTEYIADQRAKNIRASGRSANEIKEKVTADEGQLFGPAYFIQQKVGRRPGKMPPVDAIIQWLKDKKNFNVKEERGPGLQGLAFAIAKKIAKTGTDIFQGKREGLSIEERIVEARKEFAQDLKGVIKEQLLEKIKPLATRVK
jgi:hypothetical protein